MFVGQFPILQGKSTPSGAPCSEKTSWERRVTFHFDVATPAGHAPPHL